MQAWRSKVHGTVVKQVTDVDDNPILFVVAEAEVRMLQLNPTTSLQRALLSDIEPRDFARIGADLRCAVKDLTVLIPGRHHGPPRQLHRPAKRRFGDVEPECKGGV